jgi:hypothetical protein
MAPQRYYYCSDGAVAQQLATLQCCGAMALQLATLRRTALWRCNSRQRQTTVHYAMMASSANDGRQRSVALQQWQVTAIEIFVFC